VALTAVIGALAFVGSVVAAGRIDIAHQFGIGYLILDGVRDQQLIEKHGKQAGRDI
jgi:NitT/TauT family transport system substrate-binding protein